MRHVLIRQQLYDMIWERAVSKGRGNSAFSTWRKLCVKHAIRLPGATYWTRLNAEYPVKHKPLSVAKRL
ncbi:hypothetical protein C1T17_08350 [Sphingobium sp. SCG-1]|nr:hypothetical protein C1T17_08350 [Sphingobium sp. SCG-1]